VSDNVGLGRAAISFARTAWALMVPHAGRMEVSSLTKAGCAYVCAFGRVATEQVILQATRKKAKTKTMQKDSRCPELPALVAVLGAASTVLPGAEGLCACTCAGLDEWLCELQHVSLKMASGVLVVLWQVSTRIAWPRVDGMMPSLRGTDSPETLARHR
jgi:hypothetical protein